MKCVLTSLALICLAGCTTGPRVACIMVSDLGCQPKYQVIGELGVPIGHLVEVHARFTYGKYTEYCLEVSRIGSRILDTPIRMEFDDSTYEVPSDNSARYEQVYGKKTGSFSDTQIKELRKGWIGKEYDLAVYETGSFGGPDNCDEFDVLVGQGQWSGLKTWLVVAKVLKSYDAPVVEDIQWLKPEQKAAWDALQKRNGGLDIIVTGPTTMRINGVDCRLLGVTPPTDKQRQVQAQKFLEMYVAEHGRYYSIYNDNEPICDTDGNPLIWIFGHGNSGKAQEALVRAGLAQLGYKGLEKYTFTTPTESGYKPCDWQQILLNAKKSYEKGEELYVTFEWPLEKTPQKKDANKVLENIGANAPNSQR
jgi:hypothetical protein